MPHWVDCIGDGRQEATFASPARAGDLQYAYVGYLTCA